MRDKPKTCQIPEGCDRPIYGRGMCSMHWQQAKRGKRPYILPRTRLPRTMTVEERFWARVNKTDECWLWTGAIMKNGYGVFNAEGLAHRFAYQLLVRPIPEDGEIDHLCFVRHCVRPEHLELVSRAENIGRQRHHGPPRKDTCGRGHSNWHELPNGKRHCIDCVRDNMRAYRARLRTNPRVK